MSKQRKPSEKLSSDDPRKPSSQLNSSNQSQPTEQPISRRKRKRRSRYKKVSDNVFRATGMPLSRLLSFVVVFLLIVGLILYVRNTGDASLPSSIDAPTSQFDTGESDETDFLAAVTIPADFSKSSLPVRIDKVNWMIERCTYLLSQKSNYSEKIEEKMFALLALKAVMIAESGLEPTEHLDLFKKNVMQSSTAATQIDKHQYLLVVTYLTALAMCPEADIYDEAVEAVNGIQESTPVPVATAISCYNSCLKYYVNSIDKTASKNLLLLMGKKLTISNKQKLSDLGLSLMDYPNFSYYYQDSLVQPKSSTEFEVETLRLLKQIQKTPPQSIKTYDLLLTVPKQYLQAGNVEVAVKVLDQFASIASQSNAEIRDKVLEKIKRLTKRVNLLGKEFPVSGVDVTGTSIELFKKESTLIIFLNPDQEASQEALVRIADSRLFNRWSTTVCLASVSELSDKQILTFKKKFPYFELVDLP